MENKKDRSGVIRFINDIASKKTRSNMDSIPKRSVSEMRGGGRKINLTFIEKPPEISKVNIMQEFNGYERL